MANVNVVELGNGVLIESVSAENDFCEDCGADTSDVTGDGWWPDQDGIYVVCPECGHVTHHPNGLAGPADDALGVLLEEVGEQFAALDGALSEGRFDEVLLRRARLGEAVEDAKEGLGGGDAA